MKQYLSYISAPRTMQAEVSKLQEAISQTERYFAGHGGIEEYKNCLEKGCDYQRKAVLEECRVWLEKSKAPQYLHQGNLQQAYASLGDDMNAWIDGLPNYVPVRYHSDKGAQTVDVADIIVTDEGWKPSERLIKEITDRHTRTLTDEEMADIKLAEQLADLYNQLREHGYTIDVPAFANYTKPEHRAEAFCTSYDALNDCRVSEEEKKAIKDKMYSFAANFRL